MDITLINDMIDELENSDTSLSNIRNLSALYNVKSHMKKEDNATKELSDILPSYLDYIDTKRGYQLHKTSADEVYTAMQSVCSEIKEFIRALYRGTDTPKEREIIMRMIKEMQ